MREERLKHVAEIHVSNVDKKTSEGDVPVSLCNYTDVYYNERITGSLDFMSATATRDQLAKFGLRRGDVVLTKDSETAEDIGVSAVVAEDVRDLVCGYHLAKVRARARHADGGYLRWALASTAARQRMSAVATGVTRFGLRSEAIADMRVPVPPLDTQRAIANYLDRETARIDALIAAKWRMAELLDERWEGFLETEIRALAEKHGEIPLKYECREVVVGIVITPSAWYADSGVPALRGTNVSPGAISPDDLVYLTQEGHKLHPKSRLRSGDVVVVRTGQAGAAAVVPPELDGINCIDLVIIRLRSNYSPHFLEFVMNSDWMQKHIDEHSVGTIQSHFNVGAAGLVPVPRMPFIDQGAIVDRLRGERRRVSDLVSVVERQVILLQERRQALITAAVTGQLDMQEAA